MSWSADSDSNGRNNITSDSEFQKKMRLMDQKIVKTHNLIKETTDKVKCVKERRLDLSSVEGNREKMTNIICELSKEIDALESLAESRGGQSQLVKAKLTEKRREVTNVIRNLKDLLGELNSEINKRKMERNRESSIVNNALDSHENSMSAKYQLSHQLSNVSEAEVQVALEEQKQSEDITRDILILEGLFSQMATMINEQGEKVDNIHANVEKAYEDNERAVNQLNIAENYKRSYTKKKLILIGIGLAVVAVLALIIGLSVGLNK